MKRIVLDMDVVVAGMRSPGGASAALILAADEDTITLLASLPLAMEYEAVCMRPCLIDNSMMGDSRSSG